MFFSTRRVAVTVSKQEGASCKRQRKAGGVSPVSVTATHSFAVPEYTVAEFLKIKNPIDNMVQDLNAPDKVDSKTCWITDGESYYALCVYRGPSITDTENRAHLSAESQYIALREYQDSEHDVLIAKVRLPDAGGRPELMSINAGAATSGEKALSLVHDLIEIPFEIPGYTLHDAAYFGYKQDQFSIRKLRVLAGVVQASIYERAGFGLVSCYQQSVGQYAAHTQIPVLADLAGAHIREQKLSDVMTGFIPVIKLPVFGVKTQKEINTAIHRWCPDPAAETVQDLFQKLLTASKYFKQSDQAMGLDVGTISKTKFYSDLNLLMNVMMSEVDPEDATYIRAHVSSGLDTTAAVILQCAIDCVGSHIVYEKQNGAGYLPMSQAVAETALVGVDSFSKAVVQLTDVVPLTWTELCLSERVGALFMGDL